VLDVAKPVSGKQATGETEFSFDSWLFLIPLRGPRREPTSRDLSGAIREREILQSGRRIVGEEHQYANPSRADES